MNGTDGGGLDQPFAESVVDHTTPRTSWWIMTALLVVFAVLCFTTAMRCVASPNCGILEQVLPCGNLTCAVYQVTISRLSLSASRTLSRSIYTLYNQ